MRGSDLLDKLENLDPGLIAGAAEPSTRTPRRRERQWGGLMAAAACLVAICLPLALSYIVNGVAPTIEYGKGAKNGSTSHQAEPGSGYGEGGSGLGDPQKGAHKGGDDGPTANYSTIPEPQVSVVGYKDYITWTQYTLDEQYCSAYPDGLPAEEYFKYNKQESENMERLEAVINKNIPEEYGGYPYITTPDNKEKYAKGDWASASPFEVMDKYAEELFSCLPEYIRPLGSIFKSDPDGSGLSLVRILTASQPYYDVTDDSLRQSWNICVTISREPLLTEGDLAPAKYDSNETVVIPSEGAEPITALGGLNTNRMLLCTLPNGMWCRIAGNFNVPYGDMVKLMNSLLADTSALDSIDEKLRSGELVPVTKEEMNSGYISPSPGPELLADYDAAVRAYIPTPETNDYAAPIDSVSAATESEAGQESTEQDVTSLDVDYLEGYDGRPLKSFRIDRLDVYNYQDNGMGELEYITEDMVLSQFLFQKTFSGAQRSSGSSPEQMPLYYTFFFTWDDYYVTARFNEELTADGLWSFLQQLSGAEQAKGTDAFSGPR